MTEQAQDVGEDLPDPADASQAVNTDDVPDGDVNDETDEVSDDDLEANGQDPEVGPDLYEVTQ